MEYNSQVDLLKINVRTPGLQGNQRTGGNADERAPFKGKRPGHNSNGNRQLFKEGTSERPQRTLNWKLGVEARFETGLTGVPSFSSSFSGAETMVGGELFGIINYPDSKYAAETGIGCRCHP